MNKNLAVIILNYNDEGNTKRYIEQIKEYGMVDKIIIVDNCSPNNSFNSLLSLSDDKIDVIKSDKNGGYAYGNNFAIKYLCENYGEYKYIAISNPDVEVSESAYKKCLDILDEHADIAVAAPRMYDINGKPHVLSGWKKRTLRGDLIDSSDTLTRIAGKSHIEIYEKGYLEQELAYVDCVAGSFFIIKHKVFNEIGYFDENTFLYFEEDILGAKLKELGYKLVVLGKYKFTHYESVAVNKTNSSLKKYKYLQTSKYYYHKNYSKSEWYKLLLLKMTTVFKPMDKHANKVIIGSLFFIRRLLEKCFKFLIYILNIMLLPFFLIKRKIVAKEKILYFSLVTWKWIKQRPHFIPMLIAEDGNFEVDYRYQTLYPKYMKMNNKEQLVKNSIDNKNIKIKPFKIYPYRRFLSELSKYWNIFRTSFWNYDKIIITQPNQLDFLFLRVHKLRKTEIYYECMDNYIGWETNKEGFKQKEERLVHNSKHLIVSSNKLKTKLISDYNINDKDITIIRNGYDKELFANNKENIELKKPNLVYIGTIDEWFDFKSIFNYADKNKNATIYIIGPIGVNVQNIKNNNKRNNVIFTGPIEHSQVPAYINASDILLLPFLVNDVVEYVDPVKVYEYLYYKKPVISTYWDELEQFKGMIHFYKNEEEFFKQVTNALNYNFLATREYNELMEEATWEERTKKYIEILKRI